MINPYTKFKMSTITCNADMKGDQKTVLSQPLGHRFHLWLDGKHIVDFLLVTIELFSLALTTKALLSEICRNRRFLKKCMGHFERKFLVDGDVARNQFMDH